MYDFDRGDVGPRLRGYDVTPDDGSRDDSWGHDGQPHSVDYTPPARRPWSHNPSVTRQSLFANSPQSFRLPPGYPAAQTLTQTNAQETAGFG